MWNTLTQTKMFLLPPPPQTIPSQTPTYTSDEAQAVTVNDIKGYILIKRKDSLGWIK